MTFGDTVAIDGGELTLDRMIDGGELSLDYMIDGGEVGVGYYSAPDPYPGPFEVTPSEETQILQTSGMSMAANVVVNPIPQNYGLITYNGSTITVS